MTASKAENIQAHVFKRQERFFLDANIWLSIYGPIVRRNTNTTIYSRALQDIRSMGCPIFLDVLVVSEFINTFARLEHRRSTTRNVDFKEFRRNTEFKPIAEDIAQNAKRIVKQCQRCETGFADADFDALMNEFELGGSDFNDQMIAEICRTRGLQLVTHDRDFKNKGLSILTANRALLNR